MERDYIMRLIEQIAALVASIIAKERAGKYPEAKAEIDEKARQTIGPKQRRTPQQLACVLSAVRLGGRPQRRRSRSLSREAGRACHQTRGFASSPIPGREACGLSCTTEDLTNR